MTTSNARFMTPTITATPAALDTLAGVGLSPTTVLARHFAGGLGHMILHIYRHSAVTRNRGCQPEAACREH